MIACGGRDAPEPRSSPPEVRLGDLPPLPFPLAQASTGFRRLYEGIDEALEDRMPEPDVTSEPAYRRYVEGSLLGWIERRGNAIRAAENRARSLATSSDDEHAVAEAMVAYLNERTAEDVLGAGVPNAATAPERADALRRAWRDRMAPLLSSAHAHWASCARTLSLASPELGSWKRRCEDEAPDAASAGDEAEDQAESVEDEAGEIADE